MGVYYSVSVGYGFVVDDEEVRQTLDLEYDDIYDWLSDQGYSIDVRVAGNQMSGPTFYFFYDPTTFFHEESRLFDGVHVISTPSGEYQKELERLAERLGYQGNICSIVIGNVS